ncbi:MAG: alpha-2-macroglobulin family protein [Polyangiaceae bacterium]
MKLTRALLLACAATLSVACPGQEPAKAPVTGRSKQPAPKEDVAWRLSKSGLGFRLSNADPEVAVRSRLVEGKPLNAADRARVEKRLPALKGAAKKSFALRDKSLPAPRPGKTVNTAFPPKATAPAAAAPGGELTVLRHAPEGDVSLAKNVSITFSEAMIPVTSHDELAALPSPASIEPTPPGKFRWIGTQTLLFEAEGERLPMSSTFRVRVRAGTRAPSGHTLSRDHEFTFDTPTLKIVDQYPERWSGPTDLSPLVYAEFNQRIDPNKLLTSFSARVDRGRYDVRLATADEIEKDEAVRGLAARAEKDRFIVLTPTAPLPKAAHVRMELAMGARSAEGPKPTEADQSIDFRTYGPFEVTEARCGWYDGCPPLAPWRIRFSNPIAAEAFEDSMITVDPPLDGMSIDVSGNTLSLRGRSRGRVTYTINIAAALKDGFEQTLSGKTSFQIHVDPAEPMLFGEQNPMVVLDPFYKRQLRVFSVNRPQLRVKLYAVNPEDYRRYERFRRDWDWDGRLTAPPGRLVQSTMVSPRKAPDELVETRIDLDKALTDGVGQVVAIVEPPQQPRPVRGGWREREWVRVWIQSTDLGLSAFRDRTDLTAFVTDLKTGAPQPGVELSVFPGSGRATVAATGLASLPLGSSGDLLIAKRGKDRVFVGGRDGELIARGGYEPVRWMVFDDRGLYKPKERVSVKGWVRLSTAGPKGDLGSLPPNASRKVEWEAVEPRGNTVAKGETSVDADGAFYLGFDLPDAANLGRARVKLSLSDRGGSYTHWFKIEEFKRPEFEVTAEATEGPYFVGKHAIATVSAAYYAGGGLPESEVQWRVQAEDAYFVPPKRDAYHFGKRPRIFWWSGDDDEAKRRANESWRAATNAEGQHRLRVDFDALEPSYPRLLSFEATVTDVSRQSWSANTKMLVHPASVTVGLKQESRMVTAGKPIVLDALVTDIDGKAIPGRKVEIRSARLTFTWRGHKRKESREAGPGCEFVSSAEAQRCVIDTKRGGQYRITAVVSDEHGRKSNTELDSWVLSDDPAMVPELEGDKVELTADQDEYEAGATAKLLLTSPFAPAEGVLVLDRDGIVTTRRISVSSRVQTLEVPLDRAWVPGVIARVHLVGSRPREDERGNPTASLPPRPATASGQLALRIPPKDRTLAIEVQPKQEAVAPGAKTSVGVTVLDPAGRPVKGAHVALVVVDESVLALAGYTTPDPIATLYPARGGAVSDYEARLRILLGEPDLSQFELKTDGKLKEKNGGGSKELKKLEMTTLGGYGAGGRAVRGPSKASAKPAPSPAQSPAPPPVATESAEDRSDKNASDASPLAVRTNFNPLAAFVPKLVTDAAGRGRANVKLPDSLTRYRVFAVASHGARDFGAGESALTARLPLMVRTQAPRFLNYGDRFHLPVVLQNQTTKAMTVDVAVRADNAQLLGPTAVRVTVPAADRVETRFSVATKSAGTTKFQVGAVGSDGSDASTVELPVWTPATTEAFATYGEIDSGSVAQVVQVPRNVVREFGALEVTTSSTALQGLTDAMIYLQRYPFECNEQIASRMLSIAALEPVLGAFEAEGLPPRAELKRSMARDMERLAARQHYSGGWDYWRKDRPPDPFVSIHVAHALLRAKDRKFFVPSSMLRDAMRFLVDIRRHIPRIWHPEAQRTVESYALYVRQRAGDADPSRARAIANEAGGIKSRSLDALGWLLPVLRHDAAAQQEVTEIRRHLDNRITETAGRAHWVTHFDDARHVTLGSSRRTDGILLEATIDDRKEFDALPKLARGLLGHRKRGHWGSTQDNVFVLLGLSRYFEVFENVTPNFIARAWLGERLALDHGFRGRSVDRQHTEIPLALLGAPGARSQLILDKNGDGRLYYRLGMQYAPANLRPPPAEHGFSVERVYEGADEAARVTRDRDGTWRVKAGSLVRVRVTMVAPARRYHVALVDWLPAGFEPLNPALATSPSVPKDQKIDPKVPWWWSRAWYEHQNLRDERAEAFASIVYGGTYEYTYVARAITPGTFVVPPPKAEEMYEPETFGRGSGDRVVVH